MALPVSPKKDLAIKESILGVLKTKDKSGKGAVKVSEFDNVISAFGLSWDSPAVKNVLEYCKIDKDENINFNALSDEILVEKQRLNAIPKHKVRRPIVVIATPQTTGVLKEKKELMRERQQKAVQQQTEQVQTIYKMLSNHDISKNTAVNLLSQHQIYPTKDLLKIAAEMEVNEVPFADFNRALTSSDPFPRASAILSAETTTVFAGSPKRPPVDRFSVEESTPGRRLFEIPPSAHFVPMEEFAITEFIKPGRKAAESPRGKTTTMGAVFNETGQSWLGDPEAVDWSTPSAGRRHVVQDEGFGADVARAQLNHGDCISWADQESELEAWNAALARPEGRKVDGQQLWVNHKSDVISWNNRLNNVSPEEAIRNEFSLGGGVSVASGQRNASSQRNILAWEDSTTKRRPAGKKDQAPPNVVKASAAALNIGIVGHQSAATANTDASGGVFAGSPSVRPERLTLRKCSSSNNFSTTSPPFGTDTNSPTSCKSPLSFFERGRTPSGARYAPTSPLAGGSAPSSPLTTPTVTAGVRSLRR